MRSGGNRKDVPLIASVSALVPPFPPRMVCVVDSDSRIHVQCIVSHSPASPLGWSSGGYQSSHCRDYLYLPRLSSVRLSLSLGAWATTLWDDPSLFWDPPGPDLNISFSRIVSAFGFLGDSHLGAQMESESVELRSKSHPQEDVGNLSSAAAVRAASLHTRACPHSTGLKPTVCGTIFLEDNRGHFIFTHSKAHPGLHESVLTKLPRGHWCL